MKTLKALSLSFAAAVVFAGSASAQTVIHIAGSQTYRNPAVAAIIDYLSNNGANTVYAGYTGSSLLGSSAAILANGTIGSGGTATIIVETYWSGSVAGVVDLVAGNNTGAYLDPSSIGSANVTAFNNPTGAQVVVVGDETDNNHPFSGGVVLTSPGTVASAPNIAFSDAHKATVAKEIATATLSAPIGAYSSITSLAAAIGGSTVVDSGSPSYPDNDAGTNAYSDGFVGVSSQEFVEGNGAFAASGVTNISEQAAKTLYTQGVIDQALLTGTNTSADTTNQFYATGRNEDASARLVPFSEIQFGVVNPPLQYQSNFTLFPAGSTLNTEPNISWPQAGHSGYTSGTNEAAALDVAESAPNFLIGYSGITDATTAIAGGAKALSYSGVPFSVPNVQNGLYTVWGYSHVYHLSTLTGTPLTAANAIADLIHNYYADIASNGKHNSLETPPYTDPSAGILNDLNFNVYRPVQPEGGPISHF